MITANDYHCWASSPIISRYCAEWIVCVSWACDHHCQLINKMIVLVYLNYKIIKLPSEATIILTMHDKWMPVFQVEGLQLPVASHCWKITEKCQSVFSCDQAALRMAISVCLSVCPSVCDTFLTMFLSSYHHEIFVTNDKSDVHAKEVKGQGHRGQHTTWPFPDCNSSLNSHMMMKWCTEHRRGALLFFKVICQISRSHG